MKTPNYLFETSWEVCNMVGGIYTVLSTKADELKQILGDNYITIGPDIVKEAHETLYFIEDNTLFPEWREKVASQGLKVRIGRWKLDSRPLAILIDYTTLYPQKNEILSHLWEQYRLDSIRGQWDYIEPVLFGYAAGQVIESFIKWNIESDENIVAHFHEWMTGSGVLYLKENCPQIATAFTTHATYLGRAISGNGLALYNDLTTFDPNTMANRFNITSQQSMEYNAAQNADAFTTVSEVTAEECKQFLHREADVITINGINGSYVLDEKLVAEKRKASRTKILSVLETLSGTKVNEDAFFIINSGRYEFKNKGIDLFINALGKLNREGNLKKDVVAVIAVPANISGVYKELEYRLEGKREVNGHTELPCTHHIFGFEYDAVLNSLRENGLQNNENDKVKVMFVPSYLNGNDGVFNINYNDFLYAFDLSVFPSYYEPWGYTPMESIAHSIPTVTTDLAGFGRYIQDEKFENKSVTILHREEGNGMIVTDEIVKTILDITSKDNKQIAEIRQNALSLVKEFYWNKLINNYLETYDIALDKVSGRDYLKQSKKYNEILRNFNYQKQDTPNWKRITVEPVYSEEMQKLQELSQNLWWCWDTDATDLFSSIEPQAWKALEHNPIALMKNLSKAKIDALENDKAFV
ncbi:MAG: DUF3417 domain-containing protein [Bacteroidales bacterium]|nr:DUF3417 domain-containing protein [Bacteroidales bacterium]